MEGISTPRTTLENGVKLTSVVLLETALEIAVFLNDRVTYDTVNKLYPPAVAASIYLSSDGRLPRPARGHSSKDTDIISFWHGQKKFVDGLQQETCRDLVHMGYGLASVAHFAETAWIQGTDYYSGDIGQRLQQALEFHAPFLNGEKVPNWLCGGTIQKLHDQGAFEGKLNCPGLPMISWVNPAVIIRSLIQPDID